ncbi:caspase domain-containing protein [Abortiporus biennis]|nr:caspase domain-containing protein [Abortiporus biennis]
MYDKAKDPRLRPTRDNILRQIDLFVEGAQEGDKFVFYYGGHGVQVVSRRMSEEDQMDEALLTLDNYGEPVDDNDEPLDPEMDYHDKPIYRQRLRGIIIDNELKKRLVKRLPTGSTLLAIFDACHSATMLDLPHYDCNSVWFPWCTKFYGYGRSQLIPITRRYAMAQNSTEVPRKARRVVRRRLTTINTNLDNMQSMTLNSATSPSDTRQNSVDSGFFDLGLSDIGFQRCSSPISERPCNGFDCKIPVKNTGATVISIAASSDAGITYDGINEKDKITVTMTSTLLDIIDQKPRITWGQLISELGFRIFEYNKPRQVSWTDNKVALMKIKKERKRGRVYSGPIPEDTPVNLQVPQLGSMHKLNLNDLFSF